MKRREAGAIVIYSSRTSKPEAEAENLVGLRRWVNSREWPEPSQNIKVSNVEIILAKQPTTSDERFRTGFKRLLSDSPVLRISLILLLIDQYFNCPIMSVRGK